MQKLVVTLILSLATACASSQSPEKTQLRSELPDLLAKFDTPAISIALISNNQVQWSIAAGQLGNGAPATEQTLFNVASLTKPITAETALRMASKNRIGLDDSMSSHWIDPDITSDDRHKMLTPALCLSHQCGFANWRQQTDDQLSFQFTPGERAGYSGEGYEYVARYISAVGGSDLASLARELLFEPAGLEDLHFTLPEASRVRVALAHGSDGKAAEPDSRTEASAADDLFATASDYAQFTASVMRAEGISESVSIRRWSLDHNMAPMLCASGKLDAQNCPDKLGFTMGWATLVADDRTVFFHGGGDWGEKAFVFFEPDSGFGMVLLTNSANGMKVIHAVVDKLYDNQPFLSFLAMQAESQ